MRCLHFCVCVLLLGQLGPTPAFAVKAFTFDVEFDLKPIPIHRRLVWRALIDWHDPANWQPDGRLPCPKDRIALPEDYVLFLNHELDTIELVLPQNGELVLGPQGNVRLMTTDDLGEFEHKCPQGVRGSNLEFHPAEEKTPRSWFSPVNWQVVFRQPEPFDFDPVDSQLSLSAISNYATFISSRRQVAAIVPHSERIPCTGDWVHFPTSNGSFKVTIERSSQVPVLGLLTLGSVQFTSTALFGEFVKSFRGEMLFRIGDFNHLTIRQSQQSGECGNDAPKKLATICRNVICLSRESLACSDPITPAGHCCPICASSLIIRRDPVRSTLSDLQLYQAVLRALRLVHRQLPSVRLYGHWLYDGRWQLIAEDLQPVQERLNDQYIQAVKGKLQNNANLARQLQLEVASSVEWLQDSHLIGSIVWFFFIVFLLSLVAFPVYTYYQRNRLDPAFTFVRFRSHTSDLNIELEVDPAGTATAANNSAASAENSANFGPPSSPVHHSFADASSSQSAFKSLLSPFSSPSIASIKSALSSSSSLSTNASSSVYPIASSIGASQSSNRSIGLTENFDNIFRLFQSQQSAADMASSPAAATATMTSASSNQSLHSSED